MGSAANDSATPAMATNPKFIFFTDFDGTITLEDSNNELIDRLGFGKDQRCDLAKQISDGSLPFRDGFREMLESVSANHTLDDCVKICREIIKLDPGFAEFYRWARAHNVPVVVVSSGMEPIIRSLLAHLLGDSEGSTIPIISNGVAGDVKKAGGWRIDFRHEDSVFGHDKSRAIAPYASLPPDRRPTMFYAGDGVSDVSAAKETDLLFAKAGEYLVEYCQREEVPHATFKDFRDILAAVNKVVAGKAIVEDLMSK